MQRLGLWLLLALLIAFLAGCASPRIRSEVTSFHDGGIDLAKQTFAFQPAPDQAGNAEYRAYEALVREQLLRLGMTQSETPAAAMLRVSMKYAIEGRDVKVIEPIQVAPTPYYGMPWGPIYGPRFGWHPGFYSPFYSPFYDPWYGQTQIVERTYQSFTRHLQVTMTRAADKRQLFDVKVVSTGSNANLAAVMPYLVESAFADFPGANAQPRTIELEMKD